MAVRAVFWLDDGRSLHLFHHAWDDSLTVVVRCDVSVLKGWYDYDGLPLDSMRLAEMYVARLGVFHLRTTIIDAADTNYVREVSTIWLGQDQSYGEGLPLVFETLVCAGGSSLDIDQDYYSNINQAREGHRRMVVRLAAEMVDPIVMDAPEVGV